MAVFGGFGSTPTGSGICKGDETRTWTFDGQRWRELNTEPHPPALRDDVMAYDAVRQVVVLFGGTDGRLGGEIDQTWLWNGTTWSQAQTSATPPRRTSAAMAWDSARRRIVLYGGVATETTGAGIYPRDTWEWGGSDWVLAASEGQPNPGARIYHRMVYDPGQSKTRLYGHPGWPSQPGTGRHPLVLGRQRVD